MRSAGRPLLKKNKRLGAKEDDYIFNLLAPTIEESYSQR